MNRMLLTYFPCPPLAIVILPLRPTQVGDEVIEITNVEFRTSSGFNAAALAFLLILAALYAT